MKTENNYFFQQYNTVEIPFLVGLNAFTKEECEKIIAISNSKLKKAPDSGYPSACRIYHDDDNDWLYKKMEQNIIAANSQNFNFEISGFTEGFQIGKYETGDSHNNHTDAAGQQSPIPRKLTMLLQLSDPTDYEGGEVEVYCNGGMTEMYKDQGCLIIFPSYMYHQVKEVTKGNRYSLVAWVGGPPFR